MDAGQSDAATQGCGLHTSFPGDENCILPPDPDEGLQLHVGPADYDDPDALWVLPPGGEITQCYHLYTPNDVGRYYYGQQYRMRPGSHHMIIIASNDTTSPEGWGNCTTTIVGAIGGTQHPVEDFPPGGVVPPEDAGLGRGLDPHSPLDLQLHHFNPTDQPVLREVWVNLLYKPKEDVTTNLGMLGGLTPVSVPPHTMTTVGNTCDVADAIAPMPVRIVTLFGHAHAHNTRFAVYHDKADGTSDTVYDSYDGAEAPTYTYNTVVQNPAPDPVGRVSGATSGLLTLQANERLRFACDIDNTTDNTLTSTNEVFTGEMCNLFGSVAGLGFPCFKLPAGTPAPAMP
ncbi:MAG TPA: hypothetical protein VHC69_25675 [Polyangiaceae bacterium]|nr:hypothetical protein [Polyangiaceae bacterium]